MNVWFHCLAGSWHHYCSRLHTGREICFGFIQIIRYMNILSVFTKRSSSCCKIKRNINIVWSCYILFFCTVQQRNGWICNSFVLDWNNYNYQTYSLRDETCISWHHGGQIIRFLKPLDHHDSMVLRGSRSLNGLTLYREHFGYQSM